MQPSIRSVATVVRYLRAMKLPSAPVLNRQLTADVGRDVLLLDAVPITPGQCVRVAFVDRNGAWRQGVLLTTDGRLVAGGASSPTLVLWSDTAPPSTEVCVSESDGLLRIYNVWDSGRGLGGFESQKATSGMIRTSGPGFYRYECNDVGIPPTFDKLVFTVELDIGRSKTG